MPLRRAGSATAALVLLVIAGLSACSGDDAATPTDSSAPQVASTIGRNVDRSKIGQPETTLTFPVESGGCAVSAVDPGVASVTTANADPDGDGAGDTVQVHQTADGAWVLRVEFGAGGSAETALEGQALATGGAAALGGGDIDGDGSDEIFVRLGGDDGTVGVAILAVRNCTIEAVRFEGAPVLFNVGVAGSSIYGMQCGPASRGAGSALYVSEGIGNGDDTWTVSTTEYVLADGSLTREAAPVEQVAGLGDEAYTAASTLACGRGLLAG